MKLFKNLALNAVMVLPIIGLQAFATTTPTTASGPMTEAEQQTFNKQFEGKWSGFLSFKDAKAKSRDVVLIIEKINPSNRKVGVTYILGETRRSGAEKQILMADFVDRDKLIFTTKAGNEIELILRGGELLGIWKGMDPAKITMKKIE